MPDREMPCRLVLQEQKLLHAKSMCCSRSPPIFQMLPSFPCRPLPSGFKYTSLLGSINASVPKTMHWISSATSCAFSSLTSGSLSTDCLLSLDGINPALQRLLLRLAVPSPHLLYSCHLATAMVKLVCSTGP